MIYLEDLKKGQKVYFYMKGSNTISEYTFDHGNVFIDSSGKYKTLTDKELELITTDHDRLIVKVYRQHRLNSVQKISELQKLIDQEQAKLDLSNAKLAELGEAYPEELV